MNCHCSHTGQKAVYNCWHVCMDQLWEKPTIHRYYWSMLLLYFLYLYAIFIDIIWLEKTFEFVFIRPNDKGFSTETQMKPSTIVESRMGERIWFSGERSLRARHDGGFQPTASRGEKLNNDPDGCWSRERWPYWGIYKCIINKYKWTDDAMYSSTSPKEAHGWQ